MNREVIAIDQDPIGKQARRVWKSADQEILSRQLVNGDLAVAIFNRGPGPAEMTVHWADLALSQTPANVRDLWTHRDVAVSDAAHRVTVPSHSVVLWRVH